MCSGQSLLESPATLTERRVRLWYRAEDTARYVQGAGLLGWQVDVRASWSTAIAPGAVTTAGQYRTVGYQGCPARMPRWVALELDRAGLCHLDTATAPPHRLRLPRPAWERGPRDASAYVDAVLRGELDAVASDDTGERASEPGPGGRSSVPRAGSPRLCRADDNGAV
ncbi:bifunctional DNA primase/polymerase [Streptomyces sp. NPDC018352]|uniref:bifunctional DNA primase/polymerase n=1 Tax=Streptomyces sp. NPDC018352 TaxID=3157194 RepID=UPI0033CD5EBA